MRKIAAIIFLSFIGLHTRAANNVPGEKEKIRAVVKTFMDCIIKKDSVAFYNLFYDGPVVWVGVMKEKSLADDRKQDPAAKDHFMSSYKKFYRSISAAGTDEEQFYNVRITEDGCIASVYFDYCFLENGKKINWGAENWSLVKINGSWKITGVIFSLEMEHVCPEPRRKHKN